MRYSNTEEEKRREGREKEGGREGGEREEWRKREEGGMDGGRQGVSTICTKRKMSKQKGFE